MEMGSRLPKKPSACLAEFSSPTLQKRGNRGSRRACGIRCSPGCREPSACLAKQPGQLIGVSPRALRLPRRAHQSSACLACLALEDPLRGGGRDRGFRDLGGGGRDRGFRDLGIWAEDSLKRESGSKVHHANIQAAKAVADIIRTTLGPRSMLKMLLDAGGGIVVTNDGNAILRELDLAHPAAKSMIELSRTQDEEVGDGTTSVIVLAGEMLHVAETFIDKNYHPTVICRAYNKALEDAIAVLDKIAMPVDVNDRSTLLSLVKSCIGTKFTGQFGDLIADLAIDAPQQSVLTSAKGGRLGGTAKDGGGIHTELCMQILKFKPDLVITEKGLSELACHYLSKAEPEELQRIRCWDRAGLFEVKKIVSAALKQKSSSSVEGVEKWPYEAAALAFEAIPRTLAQNCGLNVIRNDPTPRKGK
uniref:T-complex protein 1 subunit gamma n=1 Tax=Ananas comosus var. bracteatus TaxID=296719 RepID=A0A6V7PGN8_ANACO|nr:unnamed protein product [Ananas comosus var. bracteatus]